MHNIYNIKSNCSQNVFIFNMKCFIGYPKYKFLSYKPTYRNDTCHVKSLEKDFYLATLGSFTTFSPNFILLVEV